jgi:hypothetical protein
MFVHLAIIWVRLFIRLIFKHCRMVDGEFALTRVFRVKRLFRRTILLQAPVSQLILEANLIFRTEFFWEGFAIRPKIFEYVIEHLGIPVYDKVSLTGISKSGFELRRIFVLSEEVPMYVEMGLLHLDVDHVELLW